MGFTDWFTLGVRKNKKVDVKKIKEESVCMGSMAAGNPSQAGEAMVRMMDQKNAPTKVLVVQDGDYMKQVTDYALKVAQRLDCEIIVLDVTEKPLQFTGDRRERERDRFMEMATRNAEDFIRQAEAHGIKVEHIMDVGKPEEVTARVSEVNAGVRYVLSKPEQGEMVDQDSRESVHVPVIDLHCSRL